MQWERLYSILSMVANGFLQIGPNMAKSKSIMYESDPNISVVKFLCVYGMSTSRVCIILHY